MKRYRVRRSRQSLTRRRGGAARPVRSGRRFRQYRAHPSVRSEAIEPRGGQAHPEPLVILDPETRVRLWSRGAAHRFRLSAREAAGAPMSAILSEADRRLLERAFSQIQGAESDRISLTAGKGSAFFPELTLATLSNGNGHPGGFAVILPGEPDSSPHSADGRPADPFFERAPLGYQALDENGRYLAVNQVWLEILGYRREEVIGRSFADFLPPEWQDHFRENFPRFKAVGEILGVEFEMVKKDGGRILVSFNGRIVKDSDGEFRHTQCLLHDITRQRSMEEALARSEREKEAILNGLGDVFVTYLDLDLRIRWCNSAMAEKFHATREALIGRSCYQVVRGTEQPCGDCAAFHSLRSGRLEEKEITLPDDRTFLTRANPVRNGAGEIAGVVHVGVEITSRKKAERQLQWELRVNRAAAELSEGLLSTNFSVAEVARLTLDHVRSLTGSEHGFVATVDPDTRNMVSHTLTGMLAGECQIPEAGVVFSVGHDGRYSGLWGHALNTMAPFFTNAPGRHPARGGLPEGHIPLSRFLAVPVSVGDRAAGLISLANSDRDYTDADLESVMQLGELYALALQRGHFEQERATLLQQLQQSQKLEAIGALAGGIAHDFNNILFPIIGYAEMAMDDTPPDHPHHQFLSQILKGASRAQDLVMQILTFSRQTEGERQPMRVQAILKEVLKLIRSTLPTTIEVRREIDPDCGPILADPTQIHSVVMNLITNAYHAMRETGGVLRVSLENRQVTAAESRPGLREGRYVLLTIGDTGSGMPPEVRDRAFDPYYTTKGPGQGTGLGLSVVHGVVQSCNGHIEMDTAPDRGTTFRIHLPRTDTGSRVDRGPEALEPGGGEHILVVDDEAAITEMIRRMLEGLGYAVTVRTDSLEALERFRASPDRYDLLIVDMTMPGLRGDQLTRRMRDIRPDLPVILLSGFSELLTDERAEELGLSDFLKKPVLRSDMSRAIRKALANSPGRRFAG